MNDKNSKFKNCRHNSRLMTDFLAGEISDKDREILEQRLKSCESCCAKFADLSKAWRLTAELLKVSEVGARKLEDGASEIGTAEPWMDALAASGVDQNSMAGNGNIEHSTDKRKEKTISKFSQVWEKYSPKEKGLKFSWMEIAASIILVFVVFAVFVGGYSISSSKMGESNAYNEPMEIACDSVEVIKEEAPAEEMEGEAPSAKAGDTSFFQIVGKKGIFDGGRDYDRPPPAPVAKPKMMAKTSTSLSMPGKSRRNLRKKQESLGRNRETNGTTILNAPATTPDPQMRQMKEEPQSLSGEMKSYSRTSRYKGLAKKRPMVATTPKPAAEQKRRLEPLKQELSKDYAADDEFLAEDAKDMVLEKVEEPISVKPANSAFGYTSSLKRKERIQPEIAKQAEAQDEMLAEDDFLDEDVADKGVISEVESADGPAQFKSFGGRVGIKRMKSLAVKEDNMKKAMPTDASIAAFAVTPEIRNKIEARKAESATAEAIDGKADRYDGSKLALEGGEKKLACKRDEIERDLRKDPFNNKKIEELKGVYKELRNTRMDKRSQDLDTRTAEVEWNYVSPLLARSLAPSGNVAPSSKLTKTQKALQDVIVPTMDFEDASIDGVVKQLQKYADKAGIQIETRLSEKAKRAIAEHEAKKEEQVAQPKIKENEKTITIMFDDLTLGETIRNVCIAADMNYRIENGKVIIESKPEPKLETKTLKANLKLWDMKTAQGMVDFLSKHNINIEDGSFDIEGNSVKFKLPKEEMKKVEKLFFELNVEEDKMKESEQGLPFLKTKQKPFSTFSIDVDTASYTRVAKEIKQGKRPASDSVRPEEFINYFDYHYRSPDRAVFGVDLEAAPSSFRPANTVLRIGVQGKRLGSELNRPSAFTILIDSSGSMANKNRLELVKESIPMLLSQLRPNDKVSVISCGSSTNQIVPFTSASNKENIIKAVNRIEPLGVTNLENGIIYAYKKAAGNYVAGGYNRVLIFTDGISNISTASAEEILQQIETARIKGITNTVLSVGGDGDDSLLEGIADKGDGSYVFLEDINSAKDLFENQFSARFREIARDVKIQVEFNPNFVREYRQVGYKNRQLSKSDFRDDKIDAGEVGAGQSVTALYELKVNRIMPMLEKNIYPPPNMTIATVRIRYRRADTMAIEEREFPIRMQEISHSFAATSPGFKLASAVAEFAEHLKYPDTSGIANYDTIRNVLRPLISTTYANDKKVIELEDLVRLAK